MYSKQPTCCVLHNMGRPQRWTRGYLAVQGSSAFLKRLHLLISTKCRDMHRGLCHMQRTCHGYLCDAYGDGYRNKCGGARAATTSFWVSRETAEAVGGKMDVTGAGAALRAHESEPDISGHQNFALQLDTNVQICKSGGPMVNLGSFANGWWVSSCAVHMAHAWCSHPPPPKQLCPLALQL